LPSGLVLPTAEIANLCRRYRVRELAVFGSAARGGMRAGSETDLLAEFQPDAPGGLLDYTGLILELSQLLRRKVDLVQREGLKPLIRKAVLCEAQTIYAA
ncbi:MAG: nucleotidyltransferase domain-containing protein, partial [Planctomycetota bacterium]